MQAAHSEFKPELKPELNSEFKPDIDGGTPPCLRLATSIAELRR